MSDYFLAQDFKLRDLIAILALIISVLALITARLQSGRHKLIDVTMHFQHAYDELEMLKTHVNSIEAARYWFNRFWNLQARQYEYWLNGYIEDDIFVYWMMCRWNEYKEKIQIFNKLGVNNVNFSYNFNDAWQDVSTTDIIKHHPLNFENFINGLFSLENMNDIHQYILYNKCEICGWRVQLECYLLKVMTKRIRR